MLKLFVDDFRSEPEGWHLAKTITEAIRILSGPIYAEVVSLDHDIIFKQMDRRVGFSDETFASIARYIALMPKDRLPKVVYIHTANPRGASDIEDILKGIVPTIRVGDSTNFDMTAPSTYKEDLIREEQEREKEVLYQELQRSETIAKELEKEFPEFPMSSSSDPFEVYKNEPPLTTEEIERLEKAREEEF